MLGDYDLRVVLLFRSERNEIIMNVDLSGKVIVITGSSKGIGSQMAKRLSNEGATVIINYFRSPKEAQRVETDIRTNGGICSVIKADVTNWDEVVTMRNKVIKTYGKVDVLLNNAGICKDGYSTILPLESWKEVLNTNLTSVFLTSKCFSRDMIRQRNGKIINIASLKGELGSEGQTNYSASKAGVIGFTKSLAKELGNWNISVNAVCPGYIKTDLNKNSQYKEALSKQRSVLRNTDYMEELLNFITYLSSDYFNSTSGRIFRLDSRII